MEKTKFLEFVNLLNNNMQYIVDVQGNSKAITLKNDCTVLFISNVLRYVTIENGMFTVSVAVDTVTMDYEKRQVTFHNLKNCDFIKVTL